MTQRPETRYAWNGDVSLAYQVVGDGPIDLVYLQGYGSHVVLNWDGPALSHFLRDLAGHARLIITDRRGWGCSDRFSPYDVPPLETLTDDLLYVMESAGSERAVILGTSECGILASLFAATYPDRTRGLILCDALSTYDESTVTEDGFSSDADWDAAIENIRVEWGRPAWVARWTDRREAEWFTRYAASSVPPGALVAEMRRNRFVDPRPIYPTIHVPSLILATTGGDPLELAEHARYLAAAILGSRLVQHDIVEQPWLHYYRRGPAIVAEVARFISSIEEEEASFDRVLATVLFTDIVGSSEVTSRLGDKGWRELVEHHHATVRSLLARYRGVEVDTAGDGFFATFDGPARAVTCAKAVVEAVRPLGIEVRAGVHTGEVETIASKVGGLAVVIGSRVGALAGASEVLASQTVKDLTAGSGLSFEDAGEHELKGVPDRWRLYRVI